MKFGLFYLPSFDAAVHVDSATLYQQIFEQVELGEALGLSSVWVSEHHFCTYGGDIPNPPLFLAALAQRTTTMRLGTAGVALPLNHPLNSAEQLAMVDAMSGGRLDIGVVRAFLNFEFEALGVDMGESRERFDEAVEILRGTWANERFSFHGKYHQFTDVELRPRPVQQHPRLIVGSVMSPESIISAAHNGFDLMVIPYAVSLDVVAQQTKLYRDSLEEAGYDPADHHVSAAYHVFVDEDEAAAKDCVREPIVRYVGYVRDAVQADTWSKDYPGYQGLAKRFETLMDFDLLYEDRTLFGDPPRVQRGIEAAIEAGITDINLVTILPGLEQAKILDSMRLFGAEVMPKFV